jgi:hypothetical protein
MESHDRFDEKLTKLVHCVEHGIPAAVENKLQATAGTLRPHPRKRLIRQPLFLAALSGATIVFLAFLFIFSPGRDRKAPQIAEIRTEFVLVDKNITIIFVQKPDFPVLVTAF